MAEPQMERFLNRLADSRFADSWNQYDDLVTDTLTYVDKTRAQTVAKAIKARGDKSRTVIISNVARLYPLSAFLLEALLKEFKDGDRLFALSFQTCSSVLKELSASLGEIEKASASWTTYHFQKLQDEIAKLESKARKMSEPMGKNSELLKKKQELEQKLASDDQAIEEAQLRQENEQLENELKTLKERVENLREQVAKRKSDKKGYERTVSELVEELQNLESFATEEQKRAWEQLLKDFPADAHEERK